LRPQRNLGLMGDVFARPNGQFQAVLEIEKCNSAMFELRADDAPSRQTESIPIEFSARSKSSTPRVMTVIRGSIVLPKLRAGAR
jgi:hypothetical protein